MRESELIDEIEQVRAKARQHSGLKQYQDDDTVSATLPQRSKGRTSEKVSRKIGMKPRFNTFADRIVLTESVKLIKD